MVCYLLTVGRSPPGLAIKVTLTQANYSPWHAANAILTTLTIRGATCPLAEYNEGAGRADDNSFKVAPDIFN